MAALALWRQLAGRMREIQPEPDASCGRPSQSRESPFASVQVLARSDARAARTASRLCGCRANGRMLHGPPYQQLRIDRRAMVRVGAIMEPFLFHPM